MKWTVGKKMFLIGITVFMGVVMLAGNSWWTNRSIEKASTLTTLRNYHIGTVNETVQSYLMLMMVALDAIIDKDEGSINTQRMQEIKDNTALITKNFNTLDKLADTKEEKGLVQELRAVFENLSTEVQTNLVTLIQDGAAKRHEIRNEFVRLEKEVDTYGEAIEENLTNILLSVQDEQKEASDQAMLRYWQMRQILGMERAYRNLMLAAVETIIDKDQGVVEEALEKRINKTAQYIDGYLGSLVELADTEETLAAAKLIQATFPKLAHGIQVDLLSLVKNRASKTEFSRMDDTLDGYGDPIEESLATIFRSVQAKQKEANDLVMLRNQQIEVLNDMTRAHGDLMLAAMGAIINKDKGKIEAKRLEIINDNIEFFNDSLGDLINLADTDEEKQEAAFIQTTFPKLAKGLQINLKQLIEEGFVATTQIAADFKNIDNALAEQGIQLGSKLEKIQAVVLKEVKAAENATAKTLSKSKMVGLVTSLMTLLASLTALFLIARSIIKPIIRVSQDLSRGAEQVASASGQVSSSSQRLAEGASQQAASIEETSSSLEEMSSMTKQNTGNAQQADVLMGEAKQVVGQANDAMTALTTSIEEISSASQETSKIIKTIDEIAFQTNLLALNAAVEAARAGEAGAGFAVVADEVRNLAMRSADAARSTALLIEGTLKKVKDGSALVHRTNEAFSAVATSAAKVAGLIAEISSASTEQSQGIEQVNTAVGEMDGVVQQNAATAEESASASEEMSAQAEQMKRVVNELVEMVEGKEVPGDKAHSSNDSTEKKESQVMDDLSVTDGNKRPVIDSITADLGPEDVIPMDDDFKDF
jgi:methyl-accepting chemotaxis protein